jgi:arginase family enzyme
MNLTDYFDASSAFPVLNRLDKKSSIFGKVVSFSEKKISIEQGALVIIGVNESRNSENPGACNAPDEIRKYLYGLSGSSITYPLIDLGNLKQTSSPNDTYAALRDVVSFITSKGAACVVLGGTQELTWPMFLAVCEASNPVNVSFIDQTIDMVNEDGDFSSTCYINRFLSEPAGRLNCINLIGYQSYSTDSNCIKKLQNKYHELLRLGAVRSAMEEVEPLLRDSSIISLDINCIRQGDSPGTVSPSPNGFYAEEVCQLARYSGLSSKINAFGVFELNVLDDPRGQSAHLSAQIVWHFIEAFNSSGKIRIPSENLNLKRFYVESPIPNVELVFLKSEDSDLWWMELPATKSSNGKPLVIACSYSDYQLASKGEIPEKWIRASKRMM